MDRTELEVRTTTVGELACGCVFDAEGGHEVGDWLTCPDHHAPARITARFTTVPGGLITS